MYETEIKNMNLDQLAKSGQCFRMRLAAETEHGGIWSAAAGGAVCGSHAEWEPFPVFL